MTTPAFTLCQGCGASASPTPRIRACTRCYKVGYCSKSCQKQDWRVHKIHCKSYTGDSENTVVRLEVKRDGDKWEDAGPIDLLQEDMANISLLAGDNNNPINNKASTSSSGQRSTRLRKDLPKRTQQILGPSTNNTYKYQHSHDGIDTNLLIFFHGTGDSYMPYDKLGQQMQLPQTATLSLSASSSFNSDDGDDNSSSKLVQLPFDLGYTWFEEMDYNTGETLSKNHTRRLSSLLHAVVLIEKLLCSLIIDCGDDDDGWIPERIFLFGFSSGACLVMELCRKWVMHEGRMSLGGAICIAGGVHNETVELKGKNGNNTKQQTQQLTDALIITGDKDTTYTREDAEVSRQMYGSSKVQVHIQKGKGHSMIGSRGEMQVIMEFLSKRLVRQMPSMESQCG